MSRLAVSNIAWSAEEDAAAYALLGERGVQKIEIAPPRFWSDASLPDAAAVETALRPVREAGLEVVAFQAILFGKGDLKLFDPVTRPALADFLLKLAEVCAQAGAQTMVFGAPGNRRVPDRMGNMEAMEVAADFFRQIGRRAAELGVCFGIEANPEAYNCNFCTHVAEVIELVRRVDSPGVRWHLDAGELAMNAEDIGEAIQAGHDLISHAHLSEPMLGPFEQPWTGHAAMIAALDQVGYAGSFSIEMKRPANGLEGVATAIDFAQSLGLR